MRSCCTARPASTSNYTSLSSYTKTIRLFTQVRRAASGACCCTRQVQGLHDSNTAVHSKFRLHERHVAAHSKFEDCTRSTPTHTPSSSCIRSMLLHTPSLTGCTTATAIAANLKSFMRGKHTANLRTLHQGTPTHAKFAELHQGTPTHTPSSRLHQEHAAHTPSLTTAQVQRYTANLKSFTKSTPQHMPSLRGCSNHMTVHSKFEELHQEHADTHGLTGCMIIMRRCTANLKSCIRSSLHTPNLRKCISSMLLHMLSSKTVRSDAQ